MEIVFPDATPEYRKDMETQFIHHFGDVFAEFIKGHSMSREEFRRRSVIHVPEQIKEDLRNGQDIIIAGAHINNWEWTVTTAGDQLQMRTVIIYKPLSNRAMNQILIDIRQKVKTQMIPMGLVLRDMLTKDRPTTAFVFMSDQCSL